MRRRVPNVVTQALSPADLGPGAVRILRWLARYPFQRAEDLTIALCRWHKQASIYRYLTFLEERGLVEALRPAATQGKRIYHVSPAGVAWCQLHLRDGEASEEAIPLAFQGQREKLLRLLPRLPVLLTLQDFVNGLATGAADVLTRQGRRADLVRWDWERDFTHPFFSRERPTRLQVDGAIALCLRFEEAPAEPLETWYTLFLLASPLLADVRLMRQRLERVLRWRESAERWPVYSQMPPLLILAASVRQAEWWQRAAEQVTASLRVDPPGGAIACWPAEREERATASPWHLPWRTLGSNASCTIQQVLQPLSPSVVQAFVTRSVETQEHEPASSSGGEQREGQKRRRLRHSYGLAASCLEAPQPVPARKKAQDEDFRLASLRLTPRLWEILYLCLAHPLLSQDDLAGLLGLDVSSIRLLLGDVQHTGFLMAEESRAGLRWRLTETGLRLLAQAAHCHVRHLGFFPDDPTLPLQQRGVRGRLREIRHTAGVYGFFATLANALRNVPDAHLRWWETGGICERRFLYKERMYSLRPDALAAYHIAGKTRRFWLEWDRGTMNGRDLQVKFATYGAYLVARAWAQETTAPPALLCVTPDIAQEKLLMQVARTRLGSWPDAFLYLTTAGLIAREGMLAPIWRQVKPPGQQSVPDEESCCVVFLDLAGQKPLPS